jgi:hypothetical protein
MSGVPRVLRDTRSAITRALEAFQDGDSVLAVSILEAARRTLHDELVRQGRGVVCPDCGLRFGWPGRLDTHLRVVHWKDTGRAA